MKEKIVISKQVSNTTFMGPVLHKNRQTEVRTKRAFSVLLIAISATYFLNFKFRVCRMILLEPFT